MKQFSMKTSLLFLAICNLALSSEAKAQDSTAIVSAFFGLDNSLPFTANLLCPGAMGMDGMPVNFKFPIDAASLSASDFEVEDSLGNIHIPLCAVLAPANEAGENRTVLLIGEFGNANSNPPYEVRVVDDLMTRDTLPGEHACSEIINLNGVSTSNVVPLAKGPSLFFAQKLTGSLNECSSGIQTIQVAWDGGVTPFISGDSESDLYTYYTGYSDSSGVLVPHAPIAIADTSDNDNFHQLCFATSEAIVKIAMAANSVEDPNGDPNAYSEIAVSYCTPLTSVEEYLFENRYAIYPNPFSEEIFIDHLIGDETFTITDGLGQTILEGKCKDGIRLQDAKPGVYFLCIVDGNRRAVHKLIKG